MSADRQRIVSAIRRIATTDPEIRSLLDTAQSRGSQPASAGVGASDAESERQCCDGSVGSNTNPGTQARDPDADGAGQSGGLDSDDPARLGMGQGSLTGVTDCATGEPVCFNGSDWLPPDGWDSPTDPPTDPTYEEGKYWTVTNSPSSIDCCTASPTKPLAEAARDGCGTPSFYDARQQGCTGLLGVCGSAVFEYACNPSEEDTLLNGGKWPEDGCVNISLQRGTLVGSTHDPENDGSYSSPKSEIELCDANGNQIKLAPSAGGGWKTIDALNPGDGYLYDSQGNQIARISDDEYSDPKV